MLMTLDESYSSNDTWLDRLSHDRPSPKTKMRTTNFRPSTKMAIGTCDIASHFRKQSSTLSNGIFSNLRYLSCYDRSQFWFIHSMWSAQYDRSWGTFMKTNVLESKAHENSCYNQPGMINCLFKHTDNKPI